LFNILSNDAIINIIMLYGYQNSMFIYLKLAIIIF